jgi:four helix bundle protein
LRFSARQQALPNKRSADIVGRQLIRAATSVAANIAEGHGRYSLPAYRSHLLIAKGSAAEAQGWVDMLAGLGFLSGDLSKTLDRRCNMLIAGLTRRINALVRERTVRVREEPGLYETSVTEVPRFQGLQVPPSEDEDLS